MAEPYVIRHTESLCPICLRIVPARLLADGEDVSLEGDCPGHGPWQTPIWAGPPGFESWSGSAAWPAARQVCTVVMEVTGRCDLGCPVCFAEAAPASRPDPTLAEIAVRLNELFAAEGPVNLQLSGGEPAMRDDLPEIVAAAVAAGFTFVQMNTNGVRLGGERGYPERLRQAGLDSVFLQFDGLSDDIYQALRGRPLLREKLRAVEACAEAGLAVVLVPTLMPEVNAHVLGRLVRLAASWPGVIRGLHLQPVSYFGRYPAGERRRLTLPEVLRSLQAQSGGEVQVSDFSPSCCEHPRCSFRARYWVREEARLEPVRTRPGCGPVTSEDVPRRAVAATSRGWGRPRREDVGNSPAAHAGRDGLARFLEDADRMLTISGMLFQDAWSIDMERIGRCCVRVFSGVGLVPFCLWNATSRSGHRLYPRC